MDGELADSLDGVAVKGKAPCARQDLHQLGNGLERACLVVGEHDADEARIGTQESNKVAGANNAGGGDGQEIHGDALAGEAADRLNHGGMFDRTDDHVAGRIAGQAGQGKVVRLGGAGGEDDFVGMGPEPGGEAFPGVFQGLAGATAEVVGAGGIAEGVEREGAHGLPDGRQQGSRGVVVEIDAAVHWRRRVAAGEGEHPEAICRG